MRPPASRLSPARVPAATEPARLVHLEAELAVVAKPPGLSLQTSRREPEAAVGRLIAALPEEERRRLGAGPLLLVHRLDVGTSGLVVVARSPEAHRALARAFAERRVEKRYLALVWGRPRPGRGVYDAPLAPDRRDRRRMRADPAGRRAVTRYAVRAVGPQVSLVELAPETGRTHQIRVHLAAAGHPVVGDDLYGGPRHHGVRDAALRRLLAPPHTLLHAWRLRLQGPAGELDLVAPLPRAFAAALSGRSGAASYAAIAIAAAAAYGLSLLSSVAAYRRRQF